MSGMLPYLGALVLFLIGLRLAAFFSGAETGFYRVSYLRVGIDAQSWRSRGETHPLVLSESDQLCGDGPHWQ